MKLLANLTAIVTPFNEDNSIDFDKFRELVIRQSICDGVVVAGTTGEGRSLSFKEKQGLIEIVAGLRLKGIVVPDFRIVLCVNGINELKMSQGSGVDIELLLTPPVYYKPSQMDIIEFYKLCINESRFPIIVYNNPSRVGVDIDLKTMDVLLGCSGIIGVKESSTYFRKVLELSDKHPDKVIMCGEDGYVGVFYSCGAKGWISVVGNIFPDFCQSLHESYIAGKVDICKQGKILEIVEELSFGGNPVALKSVLAYLGLIKNTLRFPLNSVIIEKCKIRSIVALYEKAVREKNYSGRKSQSAV